MSSSNPDQKTHAEVIIVGAGPVGMLTALRLGQAGVDTLVVEGHETLLNTTRAIVYMPVVIPVLKQLGIFDKVLKEAYLNTQGVSWRDIDGKPLARLPLGASSSPDGLTGVIQIGQWRMNTLVLEELKKYPSVTVRFGLKLTSLIDDPSSPLIHLTAQPAALPSSGPVRLTSSSYILGTDGANSTTRRLLDLPLTGFTYDSFRMIGLDVIYDFMAHQSFAPLNFVVHPTAWAVIAYSGEQEGSIPHHPTDPSRNTRPLWRVAYSEPSNLPDDQDSIHTRASDQLRQYITPDNPFTILRAEPYTLHQRSAAQAISSRVALAGDALHTNNPIGGLGLTTGILDAFCYGNALARAVRGPGGPDLVRDCAASRLRVWREVTDAMSQANLERLSAADEEPAGQARAAFFAGLNGEDAQRAQVAGKMQTAMQALLPRDFGEGVDELVRIVPDANGS